jgi:hypothetical protein
MSSVHIGPTAGWAVLGGGLTAAAAALLGRLRAGLLLPPALAAYACLLAAFHVWVQREYVRAWVAQQEFWQDVVAECPDVGPGTVILFPLVPQTSEMALNQGWADYTVFPQLFRVPPEWGPTPRAFPVGNKCWGAVPRDYAGYDWDEVEREGDALYWRHWMPLTRASTVEWPRLEPGNVILLRHREDGRFERVYGTVTMAGVDFPLKPRGQVTFGFRPNPLYPAMFPRGLRRPPAVAAR